MILRLEVDFFLGNYCFFGEGVYIFGFFFYRNVEFSNFRVFYDIIREISFLYVMCVENVFLGLLKGKIIFRKNF